MKLKIVKKPPKIDFDESSWNWLCGVNLAQHGSVISIVNSEDGSEFDIVGLPEAVSHISIRRPDQEFESKVEDFNLSKEALYVVGLVLNCPIEAMDFLYASTGEFVIRTRLLNYLRHQLGWTSRRVRSVFSELAKYVEEIGE